MRYGSVHEPRGWCDSCVLQLFVKLFARISFFSLCLFHLLLLYYILSYDFNANWKSMVCHVYGVPGIMENYKMALKRWDVSHMCYKYMRLPYTYPSQQTLCTDLPMLRHSKKPKDSVHFDDMRGFCLKRQNCVSILHSAVKFITCLKYFCHRNEQILHHNCVCAFQLTGSITITGDVTHGLFDVCQLMRQSMICQRCNCKWNCVTFMLTVK